MRANVISADPAWSFRVWSSKGHGRSAEHHYSTMSLDAMKALPVASIASDDCALFMWSTFPTLPDAFELGKAWGFEYKTMAFIWIKTVPRTQGKYTFLPVEDANQYHMGMGYWTRANAEPCLLFTRGKPQRINKGVRQLIVAPVQEHSRKPDEQYQRMESLIRAETRVELFARRKRLGWYCFGNEITGNDLSVDIAQFAGLADDAK